MVSIWLGHMENSVPCIWPADPYENVIFSRKVGDNVSFSLTSVFSPDYDVHKSFVFGAIETQMACGSYESILFV